MPEAALEAEPEAEPTAEPPPPPLPPPALASPDPRADADADALADAGAEAASVAMAPAEGLADDEAPAPGPPKVAVVALFDFPGVEDADLPFGDGDVFDADEIELAAQEREGGWVRGWHRGRAGVFPSNYVKRA